MSFATIPEKLVRTSDILEARVLIVDDLEANVLLLDRLLRGAGYSAVSTTMNPREVLELHREHDFALILLDLKMPGFDGFQVMDSLLQLEPDGELPVLVVTTEPGHKLKALRAGARDFVSKPLDLAEVLIRVHNIIEVRLLQRVTSRLTDELVALRA